MNYSYICSHSVALNTYLATVPKCVPAKDHLLFNLPLNDEEVAEDKENEEDEDDNERCGEVPDII